MESRAYSGGRSGPGSTAAPHGRPQFYAEDDDVFEVALHEPQPTSQHLPEVFVHDVWERQRFTKKDLATVEGEPVTVVHPGRPNSDSGPDFSGAALRIGEVDWIGDVEIHLHSGQWNEHRHQEDTRYNSVVLHVTLYADVWTGSLRRADGSVLPEVVLFPRLMDPVRQLIHEYHNRDRPAIICAPQWKNVPETLVRQWIDELSERRFAARARRVRKTSEFGFDASQHLYERIFAALGYAKNAQPMRELTQRLPLRFVTRELRPDDLEACFLGVAGLIPRPADLLDADRETADYAMALRETYERLRLRLELHPMRRESWKFFRLRPANFPPIRIAQGVALLRRGGLLTSQPISRLRAACLSDHALRSLRRCFYVELPAFWKNHVRLEKASSTTSAEIGKQRIDVILVNAVLPVLARMAAQKQDAELERATVSVLEQIPPEKDEIVRIFRKLGTRPHSAKEAQGMHELYRNHCLEARCVSCRIGQELLNRSP